MNRFVRLFPSLLAAGLVAGCAAQPPAQPDAAGFLAGLIHGVTALIALAIGLVSPVRIYAFPNAGWFYDAGFVAGFCISILLLLIPLMARVGGFITRGH